ncbi:hypothetical protein [Dictyobacter formicarum]|nr:hypothetical protein [Dictyobacter formicarum]
MSHQHINVSVMLNSGQVIKFIGSTNTGGQIAGKSFDIYNATQTTKQDYGNWTTTPYQAENLHINSTKSALMSNKSTGT